MSDSQERTHRIAGPTAGSGRRLSDKILVAFHQACDAGEYDVAENLLRTLELMLTRKPLPALIGRRRNMENLVAAHERLWQLRNPDTDR